MDEMGKCRCRRCGSMIHWDAEKQTYVDDKTDLQQYCWVDEVLGSSLHVPVIG